MYPFLLLSALLSLLAGIILLLASLWYRVPDHPSITGIGIWRTLAFWKCRKLYSPPGYRLYILGIIFFGLGILIQQYCNWFMGQ